MIGRRAVGWGVGHFYVTIFTPATWACQGRWNGDPHDMGGGSGWSEDDPGDWLLPYWMARYYGLIV